MNPWSLPVELLRPQHERIDYRAAHRLEDGVERSGGEPVLEFELHAKMHPRAAIADGLEAPLAGEAAKRSVDQMHEYLRIRRQRVAGGEFRAHQSALNPHRG